MRSRGAEANQTLVLIDGIEVNDPALGSEFDFAHLLTRGIGRVEILRGPQSSLWGSDALGGVISVTTARPVGPLSFDASAEGGSFGTRSAGLALGAARDRYRYAINGDYVKTGGTNVARRGGEDDGYDNGTLSFTAELTPTQPLALDVAYRHVHANSEFDPAPFPDFVPQDGDRESKITQDYARATLAWNSHRWSHSLAASFLDTDNENFADGTRTTKIAGARKKLTYQLHGELGTATREHAFTFAFERETEEFRQRGAVSVFGNPNPDQEATGTAFAGEYRLQAAERWFLSLAGRYDHNDAFQNAHTWRVAAARSLNRDVRVHASVSTGIKNPTFVERFGFTPDTFIGNPALDPERSLGAEAGIRKSFREERLNTELVFFYEQLEDEINGFFFEPSLGGFTAINR
ncbi:MAG: TonB-dependent receptor, partial [Gammaproteobacteria bacterium]